MVADEVRSKVKTNLPTRLAADDCEVAWDFIRQNLKDVAEGGYISDIPGLSVLDHTEGKVIRRRDN